MVKIIITILVTAISVLTYCLFSDEELNPDAKQTLEYFSKPANLKNNAFIALIALGIEEPDAYQQAVMNYSKALDQMTLIEYPNIDQFLHNYEDAKYCTLISTGCFEQLSTNRHAIEQEINTIKEKLKQFRAISDYQNFEFLDIQITRPKFSLVTLYNLSAIEIYYLIEDKKLNQAAKQLAQLLKLARKLRQSDPNPVFFVSFAVNIKILFQPLVEHLYQHNFSNWDLLSDNLRPINNRQILLNDHYLSEYALTAKMISHRLGSQASIFYKPNLTINQLYHHYEQLLIPIESSTKELPKYIAKTAEINQQLANHKSKLIDNLIWSKITNLRNYLGFLMRLNVTPKFIHSADELLETNLRLILLNALIQNQYKATEQVINSPEFINPYTGEKPIFRNNQLCFEMNEIICVNLHANRTLEVN